MVWLGFEVDNFEEEEEKEACLYTSSGKTSYNIGIDCLMLIRTYNMIMITVYPIICGYFSVINPFLCFELLFCCLICTLNVRRMST